MYQGLKIVDFHVHFPTQKPMFGVEMKRLNALGEELSPERKAITREHAKAYNADWKMGWDFPSPDTEKRDDKTLVDMWQSEIDRYELEAVGFVTGGGNENLHQICEGRDKFVGYAHHDPCADNAVEELYKAVEEYGFKGYKMLGPTLSKPVYSTDLYPIWEACADLEIPVLIHMGILGAGGGLAWNENMNPMKLNGPARDFPDVNFVIPHFGCSWVRETLQLCWACANVMIDTSGSNQWVRWVEHEWNLNRLFSKYLQTIGSSRILFGTDSSWFPRGFAYRYLQDQVRAAKEINMNQRDMEKIFAENAANLLKLEI